MRLNRHISMLIILLSFLLLTNVIYATDNENNELTENLNTNDNNYPDIPDNTEVNVRNVKTGSDLRTAITNITNSDEKYHELNLKQNSYTLQSMFKTTKNIENEKVIRINGNNSIITCVNSFIYNYPKVTLIINNLTVKNAHNTLGGSIYNTGNLIINNSIFENNTATSTDIEGGGAIHNRGNLSVCNTIFKNNTAYKSGSAIYTLFSQDKDDGSKVYINNCTFEGNLALEGSTLDSLNSLNVIIKSSTFENNTSNGPSINNENAKMTIQNTTIRSENASTIISNNGNLSINDLNIVENSLPENLISNFNFLSIYNSQIINNNITNTCGIINYNESATCKINNSIFQNNTSKNDNGILKSDVGTINVANTRFYNNTVTDLFIGTVENFVIVQDNEYLGNNLKSYLNYNYSSTENTVEINGSLKSDEIYNTTVNLGKIYIFQDETSLSENDASDSFNITSSFDKNGNLTLKLVYDGEIHFQSQTRNLSVSISNEYSITISDLPENYVYGENISYNIIVENLGNQDIRNIKLQYLIPNELIYLNSSYYIDENNICTIPELSVNECKIISINTTTNRYRNLELNFNLFNVNNNSYITVSKEVEFIKPSITINKINSHAGDTVNISATINNYAKESIDSIEYKFQYKKNSDISFEYYNNTLTILNYKLADNLMSKEYNVEIICNDELLTDSFSNKSKLSISKYDTHSLIDSNVSNNLLNISAKIFDSNDNPVNSGTVIVKINGISVKSLKVTNGNISIVNYKIDKKYQKEDYTLLLVYSGNNQYNSHKNSHTVNIIKEKTILSLSYGIKGNTINFIYDIKGNTNNLNLDEGFIVFKINSKSLSAKMDLSKDEIVLSYDISNILNIRNITLSFYGTKLYEKNSLTVNVTDDRI